MTFKVKFDTDNAADEHLRREIADYLKRLNERLSGPQKAKRKRQKPLSKAKRKRQKPLSKAKRTPIAVKNAGLG